MRLTGGILGSIALLSCIPSLGHAYEICPNIQTSPIQLSLSFEPTRPVYDNSVSIRLLTSQVPGPRRSRTLGLTIVEQSFSTRLAGKSVQARGGGVCFYPTKAEVKLSYPSIRVLIGREYKPGSCEYRETLRHEHQHVSAALDTARDVLPRMRFSLMKSTKLRNLSRVVADSDLEAEKEVMDILKKLVQPYLDEIREESERKNQRIDSADSYRRVRALCRSW